MRQQRLTASQRRSARHCDGLKSWSDATKEAETLIGDGVDVRINRGSLSIKAFRNGVLNNPNDETPAWRTFHSNGTPKGVFWMVEGEMHDPSPGVAAYRTWFSDGLANITTHFEHGNVVSQPIEAA